MHGQKNIKLCIKLVIETSLYYDARSEKHQIHAMLKFFVSFPEIIQSGSNTKKIKSGQHSPTTHTLRKCQTLRLGAPMASPGLVQYDRNLYSIFCSVKTNSPHVTQLYVSR
jgi:hypothetical protein